jgi:hypothetical protein
MGTVLLFDDHAKSRPVHSRADAASSGLQVTQIRRAAGQWRRTDRDKYDIARSHGFGHLGCKLDAATLRACSDQFP